LLDKSGKLDRAVLHDLNARSGAPNTHGSQWSVDFHVAGNTSNFVFNQTPVTENASSMVVSDGAILPLSGTINNSGAIVLNSTGDVTGLQIAADGMTLEGGGQLTLSGNSVAEIVGTTPVSTLTNVDNAISGAGQIGSGDGTLTLINEVHGTIDANAAGSTLTLATGNTITNDGILEASNGGILLIHDPVSGSGSAIIAGGTLTLSAQANMNITFVNGTAITPTYGELVLDNAPNFSGQIVGFGGTAPDTAHSDAIDLAGFNFASTTFSEASSNGNVVLTATDGNSVATLTFANFNGTLNFASDGNGGTLITDPPATNPAQTNSSFLQSNDQINFATDGPNAKSLTQGIKDQSFTTTGRNDGPGGQSTSVSIGGSGDDHFIFENDFGADAGTNLKWQHDMLALDVHSLQQLSALITAEAHGETVIGLGHDDSLTLPGVTTVALEAHLARLQKLMHLL